MLNESWIFGYDYCLLICLLFYSKARLTLNCHGNIFHFQIKFSRKSTITSVLEKRLSEYSSARDMLVSNVPKAFLRC